VILGKIIGALIGFFAAGPFGAIVGIFAGHFFDRGIGQAMGFDYGADRQRLQQLFFETTFTVMGHLAKADGRVSEAEVQQAEALMTRLGLSPENRVQAIEFFKQGAGPDFQLQPSIANFISEGGRQQNLPVMLIEFLFTIALADGELHPAEQDILTRTASYLGINARQFEQLLSMLTAQQRFSGAGADGGTRGRPVPGPGDVEQAYRALGVNSGDSDKDIKKAYRRLMSQHHPDKLIAQGVPEDMMKIATEKAQNIQAAYDLVKAARK